MTGALTVAESWFSVRPVADGITLVVTGTGIAPVAWVLSGLIDAGQRVITVATHTNAADLSRLRLLPLSAPCRPAPARGMVVRSVVLVWPVIGVKEAPAC